jgi:hypothetical protein
MTGSAKREARVRMRIHANPCRGAVRPFQDTSGTAADVQDAFAAILGRTDTEVVRETPFEVVAAKWSLNGRVVLPVAELGVPLRFERMQARMNTLAYVSTELDDPGGYARGVVRHRFKQADSRSEEPASSQAGQTIGNERSHHQIA